MIDGGDDRVGGGSGCGAAALGDAIDVGGLHERHLRPQAASGRLIKGRVQLGA